MNKQELRRKLKTFQREHNIDLYEAYATHGGAMVLMGLLEETQDIDIRVKDTVWRKLITAGHMLETLEACGSKPATQQITIDDISIQLAPRDDMFADIIFEGGLAYTNHAMTLRHYRELNREKDQPRIRLLTGE